MSSKACARKNEPIAQTLGGPGARKGPVCLGVYKTGNGAWESLADWLPGSTCAAKYTNRQVSPRLSFRLNLGILFGPCGRPKSTLSNRRWANSRLAPTGSSRLGGTSGGLCRPRNLYPVCRLLCGFYRGTRGSGDDEANSKECPAARPFIRDVQQMNAEHIMQKHISPAS